MLYAYVFLFCFLILTRHSHTPHTHIQRGRSTLVSTDPQKHNLGKAVDGHVKGVLASRVVSDFLLSREVATKQRMHVKLMYGVVELGAVKRNVFSQAGGLAKPFFSPPPLIRAGSHGTQKVWRAV